MEPFLLRQKEDHPGLFHILLWSEQDFKVTAGLSSRLGGMSEGVFHSLNCGLHVFDDRDRVIANRNLVADELGFPRGAWTCAEQVHDNRVHLVTETDKGKGHLSLESAIPSTDALITDRRGVLLTALFADCVPLYFYDPVQQAIGLAHAGWRGTALQIADATIKKMIDAFGTRPEDLLAAIGPSIGRCCYEVDEMVMSRIRPVLNYLPTLSGSRMYYEDKSNGKAMLDLQEINRQIMIKAGILPIHIEVSKLCSGCNTHWFFSHRKEIGKTGRMAAWIGLRER